MTHPLADRLREHMSGGYDLDGGKCIARGAACGVRIDIARAADELDRTAIVIKDLLNARTDRQRDGAILNARTALAGLKQ